MRPQIPPTPVVPAWVRPPQWLAMPSLSTEGFIGLIAITNDDSNYVALMCQGAYSVDWGDGTGPHNFANAAVAQNQYNFSTFDPSNLTLTNQGYKQALITVTPQSANTLIIVNLQQKHTALSPSAAYCVPWLDLAMYLPNCVSNASVVVGGSTVTLSMLQRVNFLALGAVTTLSLYGCASLQSFSMAPITSLTSCNNMFYGCYALRSVPLFDTSSVTNFSSMFLNCYSITTVPLFNTSLGQNFTNMFYGCYSLKSVPLFDTGAATTLNGMFYFCYNLQTVPLFNTALVQVFTGMFYQCNSLQSVPMFNMISAQTLTSMFYACYSLQSVPAFNTVNVTGFSGMFNNCISLRYVPALNTAAGTVFTNIFNSCYSLVSAPLAGTKYSISYANCKMSEADLVAVFNALGTCSGQTITVTGTYGDAALTAADKKIATDKGWTIAA